MHDDSFGTREDTLFDLASTLARSKAFLPSPPTLDEANPIEDFAYIYLYLTPEDYEIASAGGSVNAELLVTVGEKRYVLNGIIWS
ncbi:Acetyl-CoA carboxylase 1 [Phytophthora citrophthora]|uniref:Acetyl-CoA carboxylase 1 n=1 Tax=Phytophthora citrophthora TaxID=4793 RepID=A0AAD9GR25_9STRA|nr:Acetyl-CoA carboxylase 1 [Phytophthora citrophthora]